MLRKTFIIKCFKKHFFLLNVETFITLSGKTANDFQIFYTVRSTFSLLFQTNYFENITFFSSYIFHHSPNISSFITPPVARYASTTGYQISVFFSLSFHIEVNTSTNFEGCIENSIMFSKIQCMMYNAFIRIFFFIFRIFNEHHV